LGKRYKFILVGLMAAIICAIFTAVIWFNFRPRPSPQRKQLFHGIEYTRETRTTPRPIVIHVLKIDLQAQGIRVLVTPGNPDEELPLTARTTSKYISEYNIQAAINGDGFTPWRSLGLLDFYPHNGDPVDSIGFASSKGVIYSDNPNDLPILFISPTNQARFNNQIGKINNAISGSQMLVRNAKSLIGFSGEPAPRTAVALNRANRILYLLVIDGRQPGYSEGVTLAELAEIIIEHGGYTAMNLDGGGSSTMVVEGMFGVPDVLNSPVNNGIPGRQRPVGNHLGIFAKPVKDN
jgi:hypothetical protein